MRHVARVVSPRPKSATPRGSVVATAWIRAYSIMPPCRQPNNHYYRTSVLVHLQETKPCICRMDSRKRGWHNGNWRNRRSDGGIGVLYARMGSLLLPNLRIDASIRGCVRGNRCIEGIAVNHLTARSPTTGYTGGIKQQSGQRLELLVGGRGGTTASPHHDRVAVRTAQPVVKPLRSAVS